MADVGIRLTLQGAGEVNTGLVKVNQGLEGLGGAAKGALSNVVALGGALGAAFSFGAIIKAADAVTVLNNQLKLVTGSTTQASKAYSALFDIAQRSRVSFTELGQTYTSIARAGEQLGISQTRLLGVTEAISNAVTVSGGSAESAKAALIQLSQGLASGTLRGDELNSVMEQTPRLAKALADGLGITTGELRKMGAEGEISAAKVIKALESQSNVLKNEVATSVVTVGQAFTQLVNSTTNTIGEFDKATGTSASLAKAMQGLSGAIDSVGKSFKENEQAINTVMGVIGGAAAAGGVALVATRIGAIGTAVGGLGGAVSALSALLLANPITATLLGLGTVAGGSIAYLQSQAKTVDGIRESIKQLNQENERSAVALASANAAGRTVGADTIAKTIADRTARIKEFNAELAIRSSSGLDTRAEDARFGASADALKAEKAAYDQRLNAKKAFDKEYASNDQKAAAEIKKQRELQGDLFTKADEAKIRANFKNPAAPKIAAQASEAAKAYEQAIEKYTAAGQRAQANIDGLTVSQAHLVEQLLDPVFQSMPETWKQTVLQVAYANIAIEQNEIALKELTKAREAEAKVFESGADNAAQAAQKAEDELESFGKTKEALSALTIARLRDQQAEQLSFGEAGNAAALQKQIEDIKRLAKAQDGLIGKQALKKSAEEAAAEWKRAAEKIEESITDALLRGFESGKGFAENLRDTVVNMFKTMVLRPVISAIVSPVAGALAGGLGVSSAANAADGAGSLVSGLGSLFSAGSSLSSLGTAFTGASQALSAFSTGALASTQTLVGLSGTVAQTSASLSAAGYVGGSAAGTALGAAVPYVGIALAALAVFKALQGGEYVQSTGSLGRQYNADGTIAASNTGGYAAGEATGVLDSIYTSISAVQKSVGASGSAYLAYGSNNSEGGKFRLSTTGFDSGEIIKNAESVALAVSRATLAALQGSDMPATVAKFFAGLTPSTATTAQIDEAAKAAQAFYANIKGLQAALAALPFENLKALSFDAAAGLAAAAGGLDKLGQSLSTYYDNFYTAEEKRQNTLNNIVTTLAAAGVITTAENLGKLSREKYREIVELAARGANGPEGQKAYTALLSVAGAFASITPAIDGAAKSVKTLAQAAQELQDAAKAAYDTAKGTTDSALAGVERAIDAEKKRITIIQSAAQESVTSITGVFDLLKTQVADLYGNTQAAAAQGLAFIDNALANAQTTGYLPDQTELADAIASVRSEINAGNYATQFEADAAKLVLAGKLSELQGISGKQLSASEKALQAANDQLTKLDAQLDAAKLQVDALRGIDTSVLSVASALNQLAEAMRVERSAASAATKAGVPNVPVAQQTLGEAGGGIDWSNNSAYNHPSGVSVLGTESALVQAAKVVYESARGGVSTAQFNAAQAALGGQDIYAAVGYNGDPEALRARYSFAVGTNYVPYDMTARIHEGEAIVPKAYNPAATGNRDTGSKEVQQELASLRADLRTGQAQIAMLMQELVKINRKWDGEGQPEVRTVIA